MTIDEVTQIASSALFLIIKVAAPVLLVSLCVGLIVSISIQEQTLTFVPKVLAIFLALMVLGHWMLGEMSGFMVELWSDFSRYAR